LAFEGTNPPGYRTVQAVPPTILSIENDCAERY